MLALLTQNGGISLALLIILFGVSCAIPVGPYRDKSIAHVPTLGIAIGILIITLVVMITLLIDFIVIGAPNESPNSMLNLSMAILSALAALAAVVLAFYLARAEGRYRWLSATAALLLGPVFGFVATTMWLYADAALVHPIIDHLARIVAAVCLVGVILLALVAAAIACKLELGYKMPGGG